MVRRFIHFVASIVVHQTQEDSTFNRRRLKDDGLPRNFPITVGDGEEPVKSYLYIFVDGFSKPSSIWKVEFNGGVLAKNEHTDSVGASPIGDGLVDIERQTIFFDVTGMVQPGENILTITDVASPTKAYFFDGAVLLNFYPSEEEHMYWIYHGVEFLEKKDYNDATYKMAFNL